MSGEDVVSELTDDADQASTPGSLEWMERFARVTRAEVLRWWKPESCLASTRVGLEVLRYFGVPARPRAVSFTAYTDGAFRAALTSGTPGPGEHSIGVAGTGIIDAANNRWDGHLVIEQLNGDRPWRLVDLSLDHASRPERGLPLGPSVVEIVDADWGRPHSRAVLIPETGKYLVIYEPMDCPDSVWAGLTGWYDREPLRRRAAANAIWSLRRD